MASRTVSPPLGSSPVIDPIPTLAYGDHGDHVGSVDNSPSRGADIWEDVETGYSILKPGCIAPSLSPIAAVSIPPPLRSDDHDRASAADLPSNALAPPSMTLPSSPRPMPASPVVHRVVRRSSSTNIHAIIPSPIYVQRSQPIQLHRSSSVRFDDRASSMSSNGPRNGHSMALVADQNEVSQPKSDRVDSPSTADDAEDIVDGNPATTLFDRSTRRRSDTVPVFPPAHAETRESNGVAGLQDLPANPKTWSPTNLSLYLSHQLSLHPLLATDITQFIRASALSGRMFLRLHDDDMVEMGINIRWRAVLSEARETLRRQALGGRIWGFGGGSEYTSSAARDVEGDGDEGFADWKKSWRLIKGRKTRGRVKGMANVFEAATAIDVEQPQQDRHQRSESASSVASSASIASTDRDHRDSESPPIFEALSTWPHDTADSLSTSIPEVIPQDCISSTIQQPPTPTDQQPSDGHPSSRAVTLPSAASTSLTHADALDEIDVATLKSGSSVGVSKALGGHRGSLSELFGLPELQGTRTRSHRLGGQKSVLVESGSEVATDLLSAPLGDGKGSVIVVRRSQLAELERRLAEVEAKLALAQLSPSLGSDSGASSIAANGMGDKAAAPTHLATWMHDTVDRRQGSSASEIAVERRELPRGWVSLGGYVLAASIGIGIVAGEVVVSKVFGAARR